jgi:hypothetical protein
LGIPDLTAGCLVSVLRPRGVRGRGAWVPDLTAGCPASVLVLPAW